MPQLFQQGKNEGSAPMWSVVEIVHGMGKLNCIEIRCTVSHRVMRKGAHC